MYKTGCKNLEKNSNLPVIIIPLKEVYSLLESTLLDVCGNSIIDYDEYICSMVKYLINKKSEADINSFDFETTCRVMLTKAGVNNENIYFIENRVLMLAIELMIPALNYIEDICSKNLTSGFYWKIDKNYDLIIDLI